MVVPDKNSEKIKAHIKDTLLNGAEGKTEKNVTCMKKKYGEHTVVVVYRDVDGIKKIGTAWVE